jgi:hypothetical protein
LFYLAETLHKTITEIEEMPVQEFIEWQAWFKLKQERQKDGNARP